MDEQQQQALEELDDIQDVSIGVGRAHARRARRLALLFILPSSSSFTHHHHLLIIIIHPSENP